jgi:hypothetical protein
MQQALRREPSTATFSPEDKNWRRTQRTARLDCKFARGTVLRYITEESIISGINGMNLF